MLCCVRRNFFFYFFVLGNSFIIIASHSLLPFRLEKCIFRESNQSQILECFFGKREKCGFDSHHTHAPIRIVLRKHHVRCTHFVSVFFLFPTFRLLLDVVTFASCGLSGKGLALEMFFMNCFCVCPQNQPLKWQKMNFKNYFGLLSVHIISLND